MSDNTLLFNNSLHQGPRYYLKFRSSNVDIMDHGMNAQIYIQIEHCANCHTPHVIRPSSAPQSCSMFCSGKAAETTSCVEKSLRNTAEEQLLHCLKWCGIIHKAFHNAGKCFPQWCWVQLTLGVILGTEFNNLMLWNAVCMSLFTLHADSCVGL